MRDPKEGSNAFPQFNVQSIYLIVIFLHNAFKNHVSEPVCVLELCCNFFRRDTGLFFTLSATFYALSVGNGI